MFDWLKNKLCKTDNFIVVNKGEMFKRWLDRNREILTGKIQEDTFLRVLVKTGWYYKQVEDIDAMLITLIISTANTHDCISEW